MSYLQDTEDSIDSLIAAAEKAVRLRQRSKSSGKGVAR